MTDDPRIGTVVAGCLIERRLGPGGMSVVYAAEHQRLGRKVALKLLVGELARDEALTLPATPEAWNQAWDAYQRLERAGGG